MKLFPLMLSAALALGGLTACGSSGSTEADSGSTAISSTGKVSLGVNSYLWHASLDTLRFMPLTSADPFGGVIISDWYSAPQSPDERLKVTVYIMDRRLRADGIKVAVFRQTRSNGAWSDAAVTPETGNKLEDAILARARELRLSSQAGK